MVRIVQWLAGSRVAAVTQVLTLVLLISLLPSAHAVLYDWSASSNHLTPTLANLEWDEGTTTYTSHRLMVSSYPERLWSVTPTGVLWWDGVTSSTQVSHLMLIRHENWTHYNPITETWSDGETRRFAITVENRSATSTISPLYNSTASKKVYCVDTDPDTNIQAAARNIPNAYLTGQMDSWTPDNLYIAPGEIKTIWYYDVDVEEHLQALFYCVMKKSGGSGDLNYVIRVVECDPNDEDPTDFDDASGIYGKPIIDDPWDEEYLDIYDILPRGSWPYSVLLLSNEDDPYEGTAGNSVNNLIFGVTDAELDPFSDAYSWTGDVDYLPVSNYYLWGVIEQAHVFLRQTEMYFWRCGHICFTSAGTYMGAGGDYTGTRKGINVTAPNDTEEVWSKYVTMMNTIDGNIIVMHGAYDNDPVRIGMWWTGP